MVAAAGREFHRDYGPVLRAVPDAGQVTAPGGGLDARYEHLRHAALHARAQAFPLGLGVLTGKGVTAWQRALAVPQPAPPARLLLGEARYDRTEYRTWTDSHRNSLAGAFMGRPVVATCVAARTLRACQWPACSLRIESNWGSRRGFDLEVNRTVVKVDIARPMIVQCS